MPDFQKVTYAKASSKLAVIECSKAVEGSHLASGYYYGYTEQEFDYAVSKKLRVVALLHEDPLQIPLGKSEADPLLRERLKVFRDKVSQGKGLVRFWKNASDLPGLVAVSVQRTIKMFPAVGWVRANVVVNTEILQELNTVRNLVDFPSKEKMELTAQVEELTSTPAIDNLAGLDEQFKVHGKYYWRGAGYKWDVLVSWTQILDL